jgi:hypothetical protein
MGELIAKLRWFPDDALIPIKGEDLSKIAQKYGVRLTLEEIVGPNQEVLPGGVVVEDTRELPIERATQSVVTVEAEGEEAFRRCVRELIDTYRGPVPMWGLWGSTERAEEVVNELLDQNDGW